MNQNEEVSDFIYTEKYLQSGETFHEGMTRIAGALQDDEGHFQTFREILLNQRFLPAGRIQVAVGATRSTTPYNCFVSGPIPDSMEGICNRFTESLQTMRLGGGIGMILVPSVLLANTSLLWIAIVVVPWETNIGLKVLWICSTLVVQLSLVLATVGALKWLFFGWTTQTFDTSSIVNETKND